MHVEMCGEKLDGKRRKGIVAGVVNVIVFLIPLADHNVVLQWRAGEAMKMQPVNTDDGGGILKSFFHVTVFENAIPDLVGASLLMQYALVL